MRRTVSPVARALALAAMLGGLAPAPAAAAPPPRTSSLGWVRLPGAEPCIATRDLALAVEQRLGRAVFVSPAQADVFIEGRIEPGPTGLSLGWPGFRAHLTLSDAHGTVLGTRDLDSPSGGCRALDEQLALVIALLIDPDAALAPRTPAAPVAPSPPAVVVERVFVPVPAASAKVREPWRESLSLGPAVAAGLLPRAGIALSLRGEIIPPSFIPIELGGAVWLDAHADAGGAGAGQPSKGATLSLAYGLLGLCPLVWAAGGTRVRGCAAMEVGAVRAVGHGFTSSNGAGQEQPVVQASLEGRLTRRLVGPLEVGLGLGLIVPFTRARFFYVDAAKNEQELFRMAPVAGVVDAALGVAFP